LVIGVYCYLLIRSTPEIRMFSFIIHSFNQWDIPIYVQPMGENLVLPNGDFMFSSIERMRLSCLLTNLSFLNKKLVHLPNSQWRLLINIFGQQFFIFSNLRKLDDHPFFLVWNFNYCKKIVANPMIFWNFFGKIFRNLQMSIPGLVGRKIYMRILNFFSLSYSNR
jgi:hypothetical protein